MNGFYSSIIIITLFLLADFITLYHLKKGDGLKWERPIAHVAPKFIEKKKATKNQRKLLLIHFILFAIGTILALITLLNGDTLKL